MATKAKPMRYANSFGELVRRMRTDRGLTVSVLARRCGLPHSTIAGLEVGKSGASLETAQTIAAGLGVAFEEMAAQLQPKEAADPEAGPLPRGRPKANAESG